MSDECAVSLTSHMNRQNARQYICIEDVRPQGYSITQSIDKHKVCIFSLTLQTFLLLTHVYPINYVNTTKYKIVGFSY